MSGDEKEQEQDEKPDKDVKIPDTEMVLNSYDPDKDKSNQLNEDDE